VLGFYFTMFLSLPLCNLLYHRLEPVLGRLARRAATPLKPMPTALEDTPQPVAMQPWRDGVLAWLLMTGGAVIANLLSFKVAPSDTLLGMLAMLLLVVAADGLKRCWPRMPLVLVLSMLATLVGIPGLLPFGDSLIALSNQVNFMALTTPLLVLAGFSVAKDLPMFRQLGWRSVAVSLTATAGTFLGATLIAELFH
jgi:hypothetical protein